MSQKNVKFPEIKKSICEREHVSRTELRKAIRESSGEDRYDAWCEKRSYGYTTRHLLLVYAMLRGLPYLVCEKKCEIPPSVYAMGQAAKEHGFRLNEEAVRAWLKSEPVDKAKMFEPEPTKYVVTAVAPKAGIVAGIKRVFGMSQ